VHDESRLIGYALSVAPIFIFSVYKKGNEKIREEIYRIRGHKSFEMQKSCFRFSDDWVNGLISKGYTKNDLKEICSQFDAEIKISELGNIGYCVELTKK